MVKLSSGWFHLSPGQICGQIFACCIAALNGCAAYFALLLKRSQFAGGVPGNRQGLVGGSRLHLLIIIIRHCTQPESISAQLYMRTNIIKCNQRRCCVFVLGPRSCVTQHGLRPRPTGALGWKGRSRVLHRGIVR